MPLATRFFDYALLMEHHYEHGSDFACTDEYDYLGKACLFLNADLNANPNIQECTRLNGDVVRFNASTDEYAVAGYDGTIKTYYKPVPAHLAPIGTPRGKKHKFLTNQFYFQDNCTK